MERDEATQFAELYRDFCVWFERVTAFSMNLSDAEEAKNLRRNNAGMLFLLDDIRDAIAKKHPDIIDK